MDKNSINEEGWNEIARGMTSNYHILTLDCPFEYQAAFNSMNESIERIGRIPRTKPAVQVSN